MFYVPSINETKIKNIGKYNFPFTITFYTLYMVRTLGP